MNKIEIVRGDQQIVELRVASHQPDGMYVYYPLETDEFRFKVCNCSEVLIDQIFDHADSGYIHADIDTTNVEPGNYIYTVTAHVGDEDRIHHIAKGVLKVIEGGCKT